MKGTFLNFFECKLSNNIIEVYSLEYTNNEYLKELREKYKDICFYRYGGDRIYFWKKEKDSIIPNELNGILIHLSLEEYPQVFRAVLVNGIANLFKHKGMFVKKMSYSSLFEIYSNQNVLSAIEGLEVKKVLQLDSFYSSENKALGITLSFKTKNSFLWDVKQLSDNGVDVRDLEVYDGKVSCNKRALMRFLQSTNNEQTYATSMKKIESFSEQYKTITGTYKFLKEHMSDIYIGDNVELNDIILNNLPYRNDTFNIEALRTPNHYYYSNKTQLGKYDEGLKALKPYTYEMFLRKNLKCAVICPARYEGIEETFSVKLKMKLKEMFYIDVKFDKYYLDDTNVSSYQESLYNEIILGAEKPDIVLIILEEKHKQLTIKESPYYYCKAKLIGQGIPSQEILIERLKNINEFIINNISLNIYGKIGGTAWTIEKIEREKEEFIIGISSCYDKSKNKIFGVSQVFEYNGNYIVTDCTPLTNIEEYEKAFESYLKDTLDKVLLNYPSGKEIRLIFHINKSPSNRCEIKAINKIIEKYTKFDIKYAIVHLNYNHNFRLFSDEGKMNNRKGIYINLDANKTLLSLSERSITPLLIDIDKRSTFKDKDYITKQIYWFCHLSFRSFMPSKKTVTMQYPYLISKLTNELKNIDGWDYELLKGVSDKLWFL